jgi:hypothetical protein
MACQHLVLGLDAIRGEGFQPAKSALKPTWQAGCLPYFHPFAERKATKGTVAVHADPLAERV